MEKKKIEDLSNLVFGLALAIGAITLVQPSNDDLGEMAAILLRFALSFLVIIWIWLIYNTTMGRLQGEHRGLLAVNILLLFLVAVEPYLLTTVEKVAGATLYAFNLGTTLVVLAVLNGYIVKEMTKENGPELRQFRLRRNSLLLCALVFYASIAIGYVSHVPGEPTPQIQSVIWFVVLIIAIAMSVVSTRLRPGRSA